MESEPEDNNSAGGSDIYSQILNELKNLSGRMSAMEQRVAKAENSPVKAVAAASSSSRMASAVPTDSVIPPLEFLKVSDPIQAKVDDRLRELQTMHSQGKFKS